ncbi:MAG: hypothetical protein A2583_11120 [Bdellovibrionales bacterium RIFOXYD1_FULL_53_11]|nr:MAG: hypothetical protein A2583_11120 [Bdellovibrionales bacterium RIFOXYD1_FULL_53_11]
MSHHDSNKPNTVSIILWAATGVLAVGMLFARAVFSEYLWLTILVGVLLVVSLGALVYHNRKSLRGRSAAFGLNTVMTTLLVVSIIGVLNFLVSRYPAKIDMTKNKVHTLSDQTSKLVKDLKKPVKAVYFSKINQREQVRPLLENLKGMNPKFEVEYVDPDKEPARARQVGIKKYGTLQLTVGTKENKIEDANEEKVTNALIKLLKDKSLTICAITDHGEKKFSSNEADGYDVARKMLGNQSYEVKDLSLMQEQKIPDSCEAIALMGPQKSLFEPEVGAVREYLADGGHAIIAMDINVKGGHETSPELIKLLAEWHVRPTQALIVDPLSRMLGVDAAVPIVATYSKDSPVTKDFQMSCYFPFARPLEIIPDPPAGMNVKWIAQTTPKSWAETDFKELASGKVQYSAGRDKQGPVNIAVTVDGKLKDSKATRNTRMVVFGTSNFATNNYSRFGGNMDFFLNAASWVMQDENLISIRAKEDGPGKIELSQKQGQFIFILTVILIPLIVAVAGIVIWVYRKRL